MEVSKNEHQGGIGHEQYEVPTYVDHLGRVGVAVALQAPPSEQEEAPCEPSPQSA